jgi:hypothetical protein
VQSDLYALRCLANDPAQRPASAHEVIQALPGGDPLAAALAAGETPSPRIVAAAGAEGTLKPWQAWTMLAAIAALLTVYTIFRIRSTPPLDTPPDVLRSRGSAILETLGIPAQGSPIRQPYVGPGVAPHRFRMEYGVSPALSQVMPMGLNGPGLTAVEVDARGRLASLLAAPQTDWKPKPVDWRPLLDAAGVDVASLRPAAPRSVPAAPFDARAAWTGAYAKERTPVRLEAAAWKGTPVFFAVSARDERPPPPPAFGNPVAERFMSGLELIVGAIAIVLAVRNVRSRRGDRQGAFRAALAVFIMATANTFFHTAARAGALAAASNPMLFGYAARNALHVYVAYLALEPLARRRWPELLIAWARLAAGRVRDPLVARHVLIGIIAGIAHATLSVTARPLASAIDGRPEDPAWARLGNGWDALESLTIGATFGINVGALLMVALVIFTVILRKRVLAGAVIAAVLMTYFCLSVVQRPASIPSYVAIAAVMSFITLRYGPLAVAVMHGVFFAILTAPLLPGTGWATATSPVTLAAVIALALWAFHTSLGGQPMFSPSLLDE